MKALKTMARTRRDAGGNMKELREKIAIKLYGCAGRAAMNLWRCPVCRFEDTKQLREGVNNHWRKGYKEGLRPTTAEAVCYSAMEPILEKQP